MTEQNLLELVTEVEAPTPPKDSEGNVLEVGSRIRVAEKFLNLTWRWGILEQENPDGRPFDFGTVEELNEDGTVTVFWDAAGCSCNAGELPTENPAHLTLTSDSEERLYERGLNQGEKDGEEQARAQFREALGIPEQLLELLQGQEAVSATPQSVV